jgi:hypothetical protein
MVQEAFAGPDPNHPEEIRPYRYIFIGPKEAFEQYQNTAPNLRAVETDGYPKIGAQRWLSQSDLVRMNVKPNSE